MFPTTITQKGQVTIPVWIRKLVELKPRQKVIVTIENDMVVIKPAPDFFSLKGSIKSKRKYSKKAAREAIGRYLGKLDQNILKYGSSSGR